VSTYQWLVALHVTSAFLLLGGGASAGVLNYIALRRAEQPSVVATLFGLVRIFVIPIGIGSIGTLVFGLWLVHEAPFGYGYGQFWIWAAVILWAVAGWAGSTGGRRDEQTRKLAVRLAAEGDAPSQELAARVRDRTSLMLSYGSGLVLVLVLILMIWKPGH
jgi:uncharacterized membrane protein